jgi:hypothetical protein
MRTSPHTLVFALLATVTGCGESASSGAAGTGGSAIGGASSTTGGARATGGAAAIPAGTTGNGAAGGVTSSGGNAGASSGGKAGSAGAPTNGGAGGASGGNATGGVSNGGTSNGGKTNGGAPGAGNAGAPAAGVSNGGASNAGAGGMNGGGAAMCGPVSAVPAEVRERLDLDPFYEKYVDAGGVPVLSSAEPDDESLILACQLLHNMLGERDEVRQELVRRRARFAIIGKDEGTADIPEYGYIGGPQADIDYINERARGLGGIVASCGEENILCLDGDRYFNESICVHEFAHTITTYGAYTAIDDFEDNLRDAFDDALASGILDDTYRNSNIQEYWAEGVQDWYDTNAQSNPPNGVHNSVNTREELADFDPTLYSLVDSLFPEATAWGDCHAAD